MTVIEYPKMLYGLTVDDNYIVDGPEAEEQARADGWGDHPDVRDPPVVTPPKPKRSK